MALSSILLLVSFLCGFPAVSGDQNLQPLPPISLFFFLIESGCSSVFGQVEGLQAVPNGIISCLLLSKLN